MQSCCTRKKLLLSPEINAINGCSLRRGFAEGPEGEGAYDDLFLSGELDLKSSPTDSHTLSSSSPNTLLHLGHWHAAAAAVVGAAILAGAA